LAAPRSNAAAQARGHFFLGGNGYAAWLGLMRESLQSNSYVNAFPIISGSTQLQESFSVNQIRSRIIDNNGKGNEKRVDFF
jgi:hypothetical protein